MEQSFDYDQIKPTNKNSSFYKVFKILGNILFVPLMLIIILSTTLMFSAKNNNEVPSLFGYSVLKVQSESMTPILNVGDVVVTKATSTEDIISKIDKGEKVIIAFYAYNANFNESTASKNKLFVIPENKELSLSAFLGAGTDVNVEGYSKVIIHNIVDYKIQQNPNDENYGKYFFQTQGEAVSSPDANWVMEDYVVGVYHSKNNFLSGLYSFCASTVGMILLIVLPSVLLIACLIISIIGDYKQYKLEQQVDKKIDNVRVKKVENSSKQNNSKQDLTQEQGVSRSENEQKLDEINKKLEVAKSIENESKENKQPTPPKQPVSPKQPVPPKKPTQPKQPVPPKKPQPTPPAPTKVPKKPE